MKELTTDELNHLIDLVDIHRDSTKTDGFKKDITDRLYEIDTTIIKKLESIMDKDACSEN